VLWHIPISGRNAVSPLGKIAHCPQVHIGTARDTLGEVPDNVTLVDPENVLREILKKLGQNPSFAS
jgi:hypothetical protein